MKELTIEEKAKRYDEVVDRLRYAFNSNRCTLGFMNEILHYPRESEDERVKQKIIKLIKKSNEVGDYALHKWEADEMLAWLEKQGEQKPIINVPPREVILAIWDLGNEWKELTNGSISTEYGTQLDYIQKHWHESEYYLREKQGGQKPTLRERYKNIAESEWFKKTYEGMSITNDEEPKWTDDDKIEPKFKAGDEIKTTNEEPLTITKIDDKGYWSEDLLICGFDDAAKWELVEQKPWSEEDENYLNTTIAYLKDANEFKKTAENCINWLKSLKQRIGWKPSDEQITVLELASKYERVFTPKQIDILIGLKEQLKKLKGE